MLLLGFSHSLSASLSHKSKLVPCPAQLAGQNMSGHTLLRLGHQTVVPNAPKSVIWLRSWSRRSRRRGSSRPRVFRNRVGNKVFSAPHRPLSPLSPPIGSTPSLSSDEETDPPLSLCFPPAIIPPPDATLAAASAAWDSLPLS